MALVEVHDQHVVKFMVNLKKNSDPFSESLARKFAYLVRNTIRCEMKNRGHYVTGELSRNTVVEKLEDKSYAVVIPYYIRFLEYGTSPRGSTGRKNLPRLSSTIAWARKRGMTFEQFRAIVRKYGTKPHPFLLGTLLNLRKDYERETNNSVRLFIGTRAQQIEI